jgi:hypothetical protein
MACVAWLALLAGTPADGPDEPRGPPELKLAILEARPAAEAPGDDALTKLLKARYNCAVEEVRYYHALYKIGRVPLDPLAAAARRLTDAEYELRDRGADRVVCLERYVELARVLDAGAEARFRGGSLSVADREAARGRLLDAEVRLERERRAAKEGR